MELKRSSLMIIHNFRPGIVGGAELQAERLAIQLAEAGHVMQVLTTLTVSDAPREEEIQGVQIHRVEHRLPYWVIRDNAKTFRFLIKRRSSFDVLHVHMAFAHAVMAVVFARNFGKKCIVKIACAGEYGDLHIFSKFKWFQYALQILYQADAVVAVSSEVENELLDYGFPRNRIVRIPNGVDTRRFKRIQPLFQEDKIHFLVTGRRHPQKGIDVLLYAVQLLHERGMAGKFEVSMYGAKYEEYDYEGMAHKLDVMGSVHFFSFENDIIPLYESADCFLLPSRGEGLSNALLEAMSMELPVIATTASGTPDVVKHEVDGILIPTESPYALADAMCRIIENRDFARRIGKNARCKVEELFSLDSVTRQYSELYGSI